MSTNGSRRPPRPRIEMLTGGASATETAAVVAAVEQFLADTAPAPRPSRPRQNPWQRAALEEGIAARQLTGDAWGHAPRLPGRLGWGYNTCTSRLRWIPIEEERPWP